MFLLYGVLCYTVFFGTFLYAIGFVTGMFVPTTLDATAEAPLGQAMLVNLALLSLFAVQHSVMARAEFKRMWTRIVPEPIERSTYVVLASLCLLLLFWKWEPIGGVIWSISDPTWQHVLTGISLAGFLIVLVSTFLINHFDLFGLRQVWMYFMGKPYRHVKFRTPLFYRSVRHPIYAGFILAFWAAPVMTIAHLLFAVMTTAYILVAIQLEERDLVRQFGESYRRYRARVPMLFPHPFRNQVPVSESSEAVEKPVPVASFDHTMEKRA